MPSTLIVGDLVHNHDVHYSALGRNQVRGKGYMGYRSMSGLNGGQTGPNDTIEYISIGVFSNSVDWGEAAEANYSYGSVSNGVRMVSHGGYDSADLYYKNFANSGDSIDWGADLTSGAHEFAYDNSTASDGSRGIFMSGGPTSAEMDYFNIAVAGVATTDFGDLTQGRYHVCGSQDGVKGFGLFGRPNGGNVDMIEFIIIQNHANAVDFGEHYQGVSRALAAVDDGNRSVDAGGRDRAEGLHGMDYVTMGVHPGGSLDFGELLNETEGYGGGSSDGSRGIFHGGSQGGSPTIIHAINVGTTGSAVDFGDTTALIGIGAESGL